LIHIEEVSHNTRIFTYALPTPDHVLGLPIGKHVLISARVDDKPVMRAYTPLSTNNDRGVLRMLIKVYFKVRIVMNQGTFKTR
jgi:cytochrome-b5 reductase